MKRQLGSSPNLFVYSRGIRVVVVCMAQTCRGCIDRQRNGGMAMKVCICFAREVVGEIGSGQGKGYERNEGL